MVSKCRQNYHEDSEAAINKQVIINDMYNSCFSILFTVFLFFFQINMELTAHYQYLALVR